MYVKLFAQLLDSSVWLESGETRLVWITLLLAMDQDGFAHFSAPANLASRARVKLKACEKAIEVLEAPDPTSSDPTHDGRRIERVPGGWLVLNSAKYRELGSEINRREKTRERVAAYKARKRASRTNSLDSIETEAGNVSVTQGNAEVTKSNAMQKQKQKQKHVQGKVIEHKEVETATASTAVSASVDAVFDYWRVTLKHATAKLTPKRRAKITARLKDGYTIDDIKAGIDGNAASAFHQGDNENGGRVYDDLELICRSGEKLEQFIQISKGTEHGQIIRRTTGRRETRHERIKRETDELFARRTHDPLDSAIAILPRAIGNGTE